MVIELKPTHISLLKNKIISIIDILAKYYPYFRIDTRRLRTEFIVQALLTLWHCCHSDQ